MFIKGKYIKRITATK